MIPRSDPTTGKMPTLSIAISPDGETLATGDVPGTVRLWHMADPQTPFFTAQAHGQYDIMAIAFSSDGRFLASGGGDAVVNVWELTPEE
jgi:WD40 repeat protein